MRPWPLPAAVLLALPALALAQGAAQEGTGQHDRERARSLDELVVTASPLLPGSEDVVQPVVVLAGEALDRTKAGTLGATVAGELGVQSSWFGAGVGRPIIRGQDGARVQVLAGGLGALDVSTVSADHAVAIEPFLADQIEILKGPATLLYGSGAIGGAVNVVDGRIPESIPPAGLSGRAEMRAGTGADERTAMARLDAGRGPVAWHADAFRRRSADFDIPGFAESGDAHADGSGEGTDARGAFGVLPNSALETEGGALGGSWIGERGFLGASVSTYRSNYGIPGHAHHAPDEDGHGGESAEHGEEAVRIDLEQVRYDLAGAWLEPFSGAESLRFRLGRNDYGHVEREGDRIGTRFDNQGLETRVELVHRLGQWRGAAGVQYGRRDFEARGEEAFVPPSKSHDHGLFWLGERAWDDWTIEMGARSDQVEVAPRAAQARDFDALSASLGALWRASQALHLSVAYDRAERAPTTEELFSNGPHLATQSFEVGDATLGTETANQIELGAHLHVGPLGAKLAVFRNRYEDFITLLDRGEVSGDLPRRHWSQADATFRGIEAEATLRLADNTSGIWDLRAFGDRVRATFEAGGNLPRIVPARRGAALHWDRGGWRASVAAVRHAAQDEVAAFETRTPGYTLVQAHLAYHWDGARAGWEVFLDGHNLTDRDARVHTSFLKDLAPLPGRNLSFGIRAFF